MNEVHVLVTQPFPDPLVDRLRAVSTLLQIHVQPARSAEELPAHLLPEAEVLYTLRALPEPEAVPNLRWIQFHNAGIDHVADHPLVRSGISITTLSGAAASQMAEDAVMAMLGPPPRPPPPLGGEGAEKKWAQDRFERLRPVALHGSTVGLVGYGSVGREIARITRGFGASIL